MTVIKPIAIFLLISALQGCASLENRPVQFSGEKAEFTAVHFGCMFKDGQFTDKTGAGANYPSVSWIAYTEDGRTLASWSARCDSVVPYGTSRCRITQGSGSSRDGGGMGCPEYKNFKTIGN